MLRVSRTGMGSVMDLASFIQNGFTVNRAPMGDMTNGIENCSDVLSRIRPSEQTRPPALLYDWAGQSLVMRLIGKYEFISSSGDDSSSAFWSTLF